MKVFWGQTSAGLALFLLCLSFFAQEPCLAQEDVLRVVAEGSAEGTSLEARKAAIEDAKREVIRAILASIVARLDLRLFESIILDPDPYIRSYDLLHHELLDDHTQVEIEARVVEGSLHQTIASLAMMNLAVPPSILLVMGEQMGLERLPMVPGSGVGEFVLREGISGHNLRVDGSDVLRSYYSPKQLSQVAGGSWAVAERFALANVYDVVIIGQAVASSTPQHDLGSVMRSRIEVTLQVYRGVDGQMTDDLSAAAAVHSPSVQQGAREALGDACTKLIQDATTAAIIAYLSGAPSPDLFMTVQNPGSRGQIVSLFPFLESIPNVSGVEELFFRAQIARLRVRYDGKVSDFVAALRASSAFSNAWELRSATGRTVTIVPRHNPLL